MDGAEAGSRPGGGSAHSAWITSKSSITKTLTVSAGSSQTGQRLSRAAGRGFAPNTNGRSAWPFNVPGTWHYSPLCRIKQVLPEYAAKGFIQRKTGVARQTPERSTSVLDQSFG